ncbi:cellulose-binding protein [filamentous cyanobacterium CCP1]|nr:cellulose-binding protein [filamentous cyanobacterium CCP2]PSB65901.1 cellulose-binding protein [filamentous cyanobacterium CCP1]
MTFNLLRLRGKTRRIIGFAVFFGIALSLVVFFSKSSDPQSAIEASTSPSAENSVEFMVATNTPVNCLESSADAPARPLSLDALALGTNLSGVADWSTQLPFLDAFKSARSWIPQCVAGEPGCSGGWSTDEYDRLDLDEQGWVKSLPAADDPAEYTRVGTLMFRDIGDKYPGGQYVVLYDGEGTIEYSYDAQKDVAASSPGRDIINVTPSDSGIFLQITATDPNRTGNYIRNIHVVPVEYENTFQTEIFNPVFLDRTKQFTALRFMDWMNTNDSQQSEWANRPKVDDASYALGKGVPVEVMVALANRLGANPWFTMPHKATDEYMANFAQHVKTCLNPELRAYVEFSNEVWNWQFQQAHYALEQGQARWGEDKGDAYMQWYGMRTAQMSDIWKQVFADQPDRVVSIMATQTAWQGLENSSLDCSLWVAEGNSPCYRHGIDAYAITGYFSGKLPSDQAKDAIESWMEDSDGGFGKAFTQIKQGSLLDTDQFDDTIPGLEVSFQYHQKVAQDRGLKLVVYEGGQHLARSDDETLTEFFIELNRQPEMYDVYTEMLEHWKQENGTLFMHFSDISRPSRWGSWGALEYVGQESTPKYQALIDFIERNSLGG